MKKLLLSRASVALMMSACTQDVAESEGNFAPADGKVSVAATFSSETRTAMTENSANGLDITWVAGDAIGLFGQDATATVGDNVEYTAVAAGKYSDFAYAGSSNAIALSCQVGHDVEMSAAVEVMNFIWSGEATV